MEETSAADVSAEAGLNLLLSGLVLVSYKKIVHVYSTSSVKTSGIPLPLPKK